MTLAASAEPTSLSHRPWVVLFAPIAAALSYPFVLKAFHAQVSAGSSLGPIAALLLTLAVLIPLVGLAVAARLGKVVAPTSADMLAKRMALLSVAAAPLYTAAGVLLYMAGDPLSDISFWLGFWGVVAVVLIVSVSTRAAHTGSSSPTASRRLGVAHGFSALAIVLLFLAMHLSNHLTGLFGEPTHRQVMDIFRVVYRARLVEPLIVLLFLFQVGSGIALAWSHTRRSADFFRTLQIASGVYLIFFVLGHMNSVFFYARTFANIQTDWNFAIGAPTGLLNDAWNVRLVPHYLLGVFFVLSHLVLGARVVALAHGRERRTVDTAAKVGILLSAVVAIAILCGMTGIVRL